MSSSLDSSGTRARQRMPHRDGLQLAVFAGGERCRSPSAVRSMVASSRCSRNARQSPPPGGAIAVGRSLTSRQPAASNCAGPARRRIPRLTTRWRGCATTRSACCRETCAPAGSRRRRRWPPLAPSLTSSRNSRRSGASCIASSSMSAEQQIAPAREEQRARVELDREHVGLGGRMRKAQQIVADLPRARADVITAGAHVDFVVAEHALRASPATTRWFAVHRRPTGGSAMRG